MKKYNTLDSFKSNFSYGYLHSTRLIFVKEDDKFRVTYKTKDNNTRVFITTHDNLYDNETLLSLLNKSFIKEFIIKKRNNETRKFESYRYTPIP